MKSLKVIFLSLAMALALVINMHHATASDQAELLVDAHEDVAKTTETPQLSSLRAATNRFLAQVKPRRAVMTCDKYPTVCRAKGSVGPDCCKKQCVDVVTDRLNCGKCGKKCKYSEMCCKGECVNPSYNQMHCGQCNHKCNKGSACVHGLCSYA